MVEASWCGERTPPHQKAATRRGRTVRRLLRRLAARRRRGRRIAKGAPTRPAVLERLAAELLAAQLAAQRAGRRWVIVCADEAARALLAQAGSSWPVPDRPATMPRPGQHQHVGLCGALRRDGELSITAAPRQTAVALTEHCDAVVARVPDAAVAVIMANGGIDHAKATLAWLATHPQGHRLLVPRSRPHDNAQARVWGGCARRSVAPGPSPIWRPNAPRHGRFCAG